MSDRHRAEMAESKLRAIRAEVDAGNHYDARDLERDLLVILDAEVWDGYQTVGPADPVRATVRISANTTALRDAVRRDHKEP